MTKTGKAFLSFVFGLVMAFALCLGVVFAAPTASTTVASAEASYTTKDIAMLGRVAGWHGNGNFEIRLTLGECDWTGESQQSYAGAGDLAGALRGLDFFNHIEVGGKTLAEWGCTACYDNIYWLNAGEPDYTITIPLAMGSENMAAATAAGISANTCLTIKEGALIPSHAYLQGDTTATVYRAGCDFVTTNSDVAYGIMSVGKTEVESIQYVTGWDATYNNAYLGVSLKGDDYVGTGSQTERHPDYYSSVYTANHYTNKITVDGVGGKAESYGLFNLGSKGQGYFSFVWRAMAEESEEIFIPAGTMFPSFAMRTLFEVNGNPVYMMYETQTDVTFYKQADGTWQKPLVETPTEISSVFVDGEADNFTVFKLGTHDYPTSLDNYGGNAIKVKEALANSNFFSHVLINGEAIGSTNEAFLNVWGNKGAVCIRTAAGTSATKITILAGCQIPSYAMVETGAREAYVTTEDVTFVKAANGEWVKYDPSKLVYGDKVALENAPASFIALEEAKIKNMTSWGYYNVDGDDVWYFQGDGTAAGNPEIRFITEGTQTQSKPYTFAPVTVESFSFSYRLANIGELKVADAEANYIVQVLASDGTYPIFFPEFVADGEWHTITIGLDTPCTWNSAPATFDDVNELYSGILVKMGGLNGELMIKDINVAVVTAPTIYTATFVADGATIATVEYEEGAESIAAPAVPEKTGYVGAWEAYTLNGNITVNAVYTAIEYTVSFTHPRTGMILAAPINFTIETMANVTFPAVPAELEMEGYTVAWNKSVADLTLADMDVNPVYTAIEYTVSFTHPRTGMILAAPITFTVETMAEVEFPAVPAELEMEGYTVAWNKSVADLTLADMDVNPVYTAIEYTVSFTHPRTGMILAAPITFTVETMAEVEFPAIPAELEMEGYTVAWNKSVADLTLADMDVNPVYTAIEYTVSFTHPRTGMILAAPITFTAETIYDVVFPAVPAELEMEGYTVAWNKSVADLTLADMDVNPVYTAIEYTVSFTHPRTGMILAAPITFTVETMAEVEFPAIPAELEMEGYTVAWNKSVADLTLADMDVNPVYTAIEYTISFVVDEQVYTTVTFTVETMDQIELPAVPEVTGYEGAWDKTLEDIALEDITFTAVYEKIVEPDDSTTEEPEDSEQPEDSEEPEVSEDPEDSEEPVVSEDEESEEPAVSEEESEEESEEAVDSEEPTTDDSSAVNLLAGCMGTVSGISVGLVGLGAVAVSILRKKKED